MEKYFISALIGGSIGGIFSLVVYYYNLKKERFFRLQEKGETLLQNLYEYQTILNHIDSKNIERSVSLIQDWEKIDNDISGINTKKSRLEEKIFSMIDIYFPDIENIFLTYSSIKNNEYYGEMNGSIERKKILKEISEYLIKIINSKRKIFFLFKI